MGKLESSRKYAKANPDKVKEAQRISREKYPETMVAWRAKNIEKIRGWQRKAAKKYRELHPKDAELSSKRSKQKRILERPEEAKRAALEGKRKRYKKYPERVKESNRKRALLNRKVFGSHTLEEFKALGCTCLRCRTSDLPMTRDHVLPLIHGGNDNISNIQPLCRPCNGWKRDKFIDFRLETQQ